MSEAEASLFLDDVQEELEKARAKHAPMNSHHEAYSVILEELDEYWEEVRKRSEARDTQRLYDELVQIAAMAARAAGDLIETWISVPRGDLDAADRRQESQP